MWVMGNTGHPQSCLPERGVRTTGPIRYLRFDSAAEAIQHAMEQIPSAQRSRSVLEVGEERYEVASIQKLYASTAYPLDRSEKFIP